MPKSDDIWLAGVDGCASGWIVASIHLERAEIRQSFATSFAEIFDAPEMPAIVAVDMPIGLPDQSPPKGRIAESMVRPLLGPRKSSVFRIPSRSAVYAGVSFEPTDDHERFLRACAIARATSEDAKAFAKQGFYIFPKIVEIDQFLRANPKMIKRVFEVHPELAFWRINANRPLDEPKKKRGRLHEPGLALRRRLLIAEGLSKSDADSVPPRSRAGVDDWLDALACAAVARRIYQKRAEPHPRPAPKDAHGLPMAIWA